MASVHHAIPSATPGRSTTLVPTATTATDVDHNCTTAAAARTTAAQLRASSSTSRSSSTTVAPIKLAATRQGRGLEEEELCSAPQDFTKWLMIVGGTYDDNIGQTVDSAMLSAMVRRGIPGPLRGGIWQRMLISGSTADTHNPWHYQSLLAVQECPCRGDIFRDISRTFPRHALFRERASPGQSALFNVLCAYSLRNPSVGYCQGMGFVVGFILSFMTEEESFFFLEALLSKMEIADMYTPGLPLLESYFKLLRELLKTEMPMLSAHLESENVDVSMYSSQWFMTIFTYNLNFNVVERIWDLFIFEGAATLFKFALAILKLLESQLLNSSFEQILNILKTEPTKMDFDNLIAVALSMNLNKRTLEKFGVKS